MSTPDLARRILWLLWGASAATTAVIAISLFFSLDQELQSLRHERTWWETAWLWTQVVSPLISQLLLLPALRGGDLVRPFISVFLGVLLPGGVQAPACVAAALLGTRSRARSLPIALGAHLAGTALGLAFSPIPWHRDHWWMNLPNLVYTAAFVLAGILLTSHQELTEARVARARSEERAHISREMHDSLAQRISLISLHATALAGRPDLDAAQATGTANTIRAMAAEAGQELRQILRVLHDDGSGDEAVVAWADVTSIIGQYREAGLEILISADRGWQRAFDEAGASVRHALLRIIEEALANARRHGSQGSAQLNLQAGATALVVECINPVARASFPQPGHGLGLPGLHERVRLLGGRLSASRARGRFTLCAELPAGQEPIRGKKELIHD